MVFTGERFLPELDIDSEISIFHYQRYQSILDACEGKTVLDAACGEGYGSHILAGVADKVYGIDIDDRTIETAKKKYSENNLIYQKGSVENLEFQDSSFDVVVSFETIEHVAAPVQEKFMEEIYRVLKPDGLLIMSSPDKLNYSDIPGFINKFHINELYFEEYKKLLKNYFQNIDFYYQGRLCNSYIFDPEKNIANINKEIRLRDADKTQAEYILAVCSNRAITEKIESVIFDADNCYYRLKRQIMELKKEIQHPGEVIEQKENYINEQRRMLEVRDNEIRELKGIIEQKENYIIEQREKLKNNDDIIRELKGIIEQKENYIVEQREKLENADDIIRQQREQISVFKRFVEKRIIRKLYGVFLRKTKDNEGNGLE